LRALVKQAAKKAEQAVQRWYVEALARKFAARTSTYQRLQLSRQVRAALGVDPVFKDKGLVARTDQFAHENVALITRIPQRLHGDLEAMVTRAAASARPSPKLADEIEARFGVAKRHAKLIARDQVSKYHGSLNHARQRELGVTKFVWRTVGDERVREEHADLDGETFDYDDPPVVDGEEALPSEPVCCRCSAEPVLDDLLDDKSEDEGED
jgi:SPP1 gp7 family putative phage head morphogenesis protein